MLHFLFLCFCGVGAEVEQSTLLSLVKTFDSTLAVYEGFCHLKQVCIFFFFGKFCCIFVEFSVSVEFVEF